MARIRTIKPEFPQSESMGNVSRESRLCFVLLWTLSDDSGRLRGNSRMLASLLYPYDNDVPSLIDGWLSELETQGCITRYAVNETSYLQINKWLEHQKIDRPSKSKIPGPPQYREPSRALDEPSTLDQGPRIKDQGPLVAREEDTSQMHRLNRILNFDETDFVKHVANIQTLVRLKNEGCDFDSHILPAAEAAAKAGRARALSYISPKARELRDAKAIAASLPTPFEDTDWQGWKDRLRGFRERGSWLAKWGPKPGETGCKVPNEILEEQAA